MIARVIVPYFSLISLQRRLIHQLYQFYPYYLDNYTYKLLKFVSSYSLLRFYAPKRPFQMMRPKTRRSLQHKSGSEYSINSSFYYNQEIASRTASPNHLQTRNGIRRRLLYFISVIWLEGASLHEIVMSLRRQVLCSLKGLFINSEWKDVTWSRWACWVSNGLLDNQGSLSWNNDTKNMYISFI